MIRFDADKHEYWLAERRLPSVTEVLRNAGLVDATYFTQHARDRGTAVHAAVLYDDQRDLDEASLDPEVRPYLEQWRVFKREAGVGVITSEALVWSAVNEYAGTLDKYVRLLGQRVVIDIKTNNAPASVLEQLGGYSRAWREMGFPVGAVGCLVLKPRTYRLQIYDVASAEAAWMKALAKVKGLAA